MRDPCSLWGLLIVPALWKTRQKDNDERRKNEEVAQTFLPQKAERTPWDEVARKSDLQLSPPRQISCWSFRFSPRVRPTHEPEGKFAEHEFLHMVPYKHDDVAIVF